jgi:hypothetical protein
MLKFIRRIFAILMNRSFQEFLKSEEASLSPDDLHRRRVLGPDWRNKLK